MEKFWSDLWATDVRTPQFEHVGAHSSQPLDSGIFQSALSTLIDHQDSGSCSEKIFSTSSPPPPLKKRCKAERQSMQPSNRANRAGIRSVRAKPCMIENFSSQMQNSLQQCNWCLITQNAEWRVVSVNMHKIQEKTRHWFLLSVPLLFLLRKW